MQKGLLDGLMGAGGPGVIYGLEAPVPGSGLTLTYGEGLAVQRANPGTNPLGLIERRVAASTILCTASKDNYIYLDNDGAVAVYPVTLGAAKPKRTADELGLYAEILFKAVTDATDITSVEDLRGETGADLVVLPVPVSFEATEVGDTYVFPGFRGRIVCVDGVVANALANTDAGTVTPAISKNGATGVAVMAGALSFALSAAVGTRDTEVPSGANYFNRFDAIILTSAKTTAGGYAIVNLVLQRL